MLAVWVMLLPLPLMRHRAARSIHSCSALRSSSCRIFVGYYVVWSVTPALHTPLMAVTNAISSVIVVGALLAVGLSLSGWATGFGFIALILASVNIFGGFLVTQRMPRHVQEKRKVRLNHYER
jgi:NAD/NADP transhydrogenase alpha subunit